MKTKLLLSLLLLASHCLSSFAQVPQGFNYQAIARDGTDPITTPIGVRITIQSESYGGIIYWVEEHTLVIPNASGLFSLVIGKGTYLSGSVINFSDIDWATGTKYIKTEIKTETETEYVEMGSSQLWSVPYSMVSGNVNDTLSKLVVTAEQDVDTTVLFQVRNQHGQTVFAVYNAGVRIYVDNGAKGKKGGFAIGGFGNAKADTPGQEYFVVSRDSIRAYIYDDPTVKAAKGGFAIGGFGNAKGFTNDYMIISPDSARVYINNAASSKGKKGGFAIGGFGAAKRKDPQRLFTVNDDSVRIYIDDDAKASKGGFAIGGFGNAKGEYKSFLDVATNATKTIFPSEKRILWYPIKNAFLTGSVIIEKPDSVGENSFASGFESKAIGDWSQAMGYKSIARGDYSTAIGKEAVADTNSFSFGNQARALRDGSYAFGSGAYALGSMSFAFGSVGIDSLGTITDNTQATGDHAYSFGLGSLASGKGAFSIGANDTASGPFSLSIGYKSNSTKWYSTAIGSYTKAIGQYAVAIGSYSKAEGNSSFATGSNTYAKGSYSTAMGFSSSATGSRSTALNYLTQATASYSLAANQQTVASGTASTSLGYQTIAAGTYSVAAGYMSAAIDGASSSFAMGYKDTTKANYSMAIGRNTITTGAQAFSTGYATTAAGVSSISAGYLTTATGQNSIAAGYRTNSPSFASLVIGRYNAGTSSNPDTWTTGDPLFIAGNGSSATSPANALILYNNGNMTIAGMLTETSDVRVKKNIIPFTDALLLIDKINPVYFEFINTNSYPSGQQIGIIAQELQEVIPQLVRTDENGFLSVDYSKLSVVLIKAVKEQQAIINSQKTENETLRKRITHLEEQMSEVINIIGK